MGLFQTLVDSYIDDATAAHPGDTNEAKADRLTFLEEKRAALSAQVQSGDSYVTSTAFEGTSASSTRAIPASSRLKAVKKAIALVTADKTSSAVGLIIPVFSDVPGVDG